MLAYPLEDRIPEYPVVTLVLFPLGAGSALGITRYPFTPERVVLPASRAKGDRNMIRAKERRMYRFI
jgi:hypothetical protein